MKIIRTTISIDEDVKSKAQILTAEMGLSLSRYIELKLRELIKDKQQNLKFYAPKPLKEEPPKAQEAERCKDCEEDEFIRSSMKDPKYFFYRCQVHHPLAQLVIDDLGALLSAGHEN